MGFIICPICGGKVSDTREDCPHCHYIVKNTKTCPDCYEICNINDKECPSCGRRFEETIKGNKNFEKMKQTFDENNHDEIDYNNSNVETTNNLFLFRLTNIISYSILLLVSLFLIIGCVGNVLSTPEEEITITYYFGDMFKDNNELVYPLIDESIYVIMLLSVVLFTIQSIRGFFRSLESIEILNITPFTLLFIPVLMHIFSISMMTFYNYSFSYVSFSFGSIFLLVAIIIMFINIVFYGIMIKILKKESLTSFVFGMIKTGCVFLAVIFFIIMCSNFAKVYNSSISINCPIAALLSQSSYYDVSLMFLLIAGLAISITIVNLVDSNELIMFSILLLLLAFALLIVGYVFFYLGVNNTYDFEDIYGIEVDISIDSSTYVISILTFVFLASSIIFSFLERNKKAYRQ